jgi:branched-chain amino acid transport system ATP-binding protein
VLEHVTCDVRAGESLGIIGPNGAGKSSLLNCINGLYEPQTGSIRLHGAQLVGRSPAAIARLGVARTFQGVELFGRLSAFENVVVSAEQVAQPARQRTRATGVRRGRWARDAASEALEVLGLAELRHRTVSELSYGEQKAVALARAFAMRPEVLLLDEPTSGMGGADRRAIGELVNRLREAGMTIVLIEHDVGFIRQCCDRAIVLDFGQVIARGTPESVVQEPAVRAAYLGVEATAATPAGDGDG